jgi:hypothetical protein
LSAGRFGSGPINVQYNSKKGEGATIEGLAMSLQAVANGMDADNDILFLILTSHGSWLVHIFTQPGSNPEVAALARHVRSTPQEQTSSGRPGMSVWCPTSGLANETLL